MDTCSLQKQALFPEFISLGQKKAYLLASETSSRNSIWSCGLPQNSHPHFRFSPPCFCLFVFVLLLLFSPSSIPGQFWGKGKQVEICDGHLDEPFLKKETSLIHS